MNFQSIIAARRDAKTHAKADLEAVASGAAQGTIPDYQLAAWLMAAYLNPLGPDETGFLTQAMADSGERLDLTGLPKPWVDKHSTGGVGDKTTIVVLPILAACGLTVVKMSGRGLGITGGTVDKLASIPGFRLDLSPTEMKAQAKRIGIALTGQTPDLAPADKVLYALRDVTETVSSIPLIVSSILSKKIAGGAETIVLDVKCGSGAFMKTTQEARALAAALADTGKRLGLNVRIAITDMREPLGSTIGNALEVREAIDILTGAPLNEASARFRDLCVRLAAHTLEAVGRADGEAAVEDALANRSAAAKAAEWFHAQDGPASLESVRDRLPVAPVVREVAASASGWVSAIGAETIGTAVVELGGGRKRKEDAIDPAVGVESFVRIGSRVEKGQPLFAIHAADEDAANRAVGRVASAYSIAPFETPTPELVLGMF